ncbi:MAG: (Fe-S)-binding protein [Candidatus Woesearchaeota archaeon]
MRLEKCSNCGFCKSHCPVFRVLLEETNSARGRAILLKKDVMDLVFYQCSLCGACKVVCPSGIDLPAEIQKMREEMVEAGKGTKQNKIMITNLKEEGNPYGKIEKGKMPKDLYCC